MTIQKILKTPLMKKTIWVLVIICLQYSISFGQVPGTLDINFGTGGIVISPIGSSSDFGNALILQPDEKIILAGYSYNASNWNFSLIRYNTTGAIDSTFGIYGKVLTPVGADYNGATSLALQSDGKIIASGNSKDVSNNRFTTVRYNNNGTVDSSFGTFGIVITPIGGIGYSDYASSVAIQTDGKIIVAGNTNGVFAMVRYNSSGMLDSTFGTNGIITTAIGISSGINAMRIQPDGKIVAAGVSSNSSNEDFTLARYKTNGDLDVTFGVGGIVITSVRNDDDRANAIAIQTDGKIIAAGHSFDSLGYSDIALIRYNTNGSLDTTFGMGGVIITSISNNSDYANGIAIQANGEILTTGAYYDSSSNDFVTVSYETNGDLDNGFGTGGIVMTHFGNSSDVANAITIQPDGKIIAAGYSDADFAVARYNGGTVGISETETTDIIKIFPNPVSDEVSVVIPEKASIEILNIKGQIIKTINNADTRTTIDLKNLSRGIYIVKAKTVNEIVTKKFIKE